MPRENLTFLAFNRGKVSPLALARQDIKRLSLSAAEMVNWMPRVLGSMMLRPGHGYLGNSKSNNAARHLPFTFSTSDKALVELTDSVMRIWDEDELVSRVAVSTAVTNGNFDTDLTGWNDNDEAGGVSAWQAGGYMGLTGNGTAAAIRDQQVAVAGGDLNKVHALRIVVQRGPVTLRVGSSSGGEQYVTETTLFTGTHSLAFTPTGDFYIRFLSRLKRIVLVASCNVEGSGTMEVTAPWLAADLGKIRFDQSGDVLFVACEGYQQRRIERRSNNSWSVVLYQADDGPFLLGNIGPITLTPAALSGNTTLTASAAFFRSTQVGSLFRVTSNGQAVEADVTAENQFTNTIRVTGVGSSRVFTVVRAGTWVATVTLQRSLTSDTGPWEDVTTYTTNATVAFDDGLDNQIAWYRIGVATGGFTSGTVELSLSYEIGSVDGICRITGFTSATVVDVEVIVDFGGTEATDDWAEGQWSDFRGWPTSVAIVEGRLGWAGKNGIWLSVSDAFDSYDEEVAGDSAPINRTIGSGPVDRINWMLPLQRLILGAEGAEFSCKSSSLDEPLTVTNFNIKPASSQGSAGVDVVKVDKRGIFVQRGGTRVFEIGLEEDYEYGSTHLSEIVPEIGQPGISRVAVQRQPDTRVHFVRSDGTAAVLVFDKSENVTCWLEIEAGGDGEIEDVVILAGDAGSEEDQVYYSVKRTINSSVVRTLEKWAKESECVGGTLNKQADSFVEYTQAASTTITGLGHLEGEAVIVWDNGKCLFNAGGTAPATFTVASGQITVTNRGAAYQATNGIVGLYYDGQWQSSKLAFAQALGASLTKHKIIKDLGLVLANTHAQGLQYGPDFDNLQDLPGIEEGAPVDQDAVREAYDGEAFTFPGEWKTDARLCLLGRAPLPCTVLAGVCSGEFSP